MHLYKTTRQPIKILKLITSLFQGTELWEALPEKSLLKMKMDQGKHPTQDLVTLLWTSLRKIDLISELKFYQYKGPKSIIRLRTASKLHLRCIGSASNNLGPIFLINRKYRSYKLSTTGLDMTRGRNLTHFWIQIVKLPASCYLWRISSMIPLRINAGYKMIIKLWQLSQESRGKQFWNQLQMLISNPLGIYHKRSIVARAFQTFQIRDFLISEIM